MQIKVKWETENSEIKTTIESHSDWADSARLYKEAPKGELEFEISQCENWQQRIFDNLCMEDYEELEFFLSMMEQVDKNSEKQAILYWLIAEEYRAMTIEDASSRFPIVSISNNDKVGTALDYVDSEHDELDDSIRNSIDGNLLFNELIGDGKLVLIEWEGNEYIVENAEEV